MNNYKTVSSLFEQEPHTWGLRGDPHLWREMRGHFENTPIPESEEELASLIESAFETLTGHRIIETKHFFLEHLDHGGMSGGYISPKFWREDVILMMRERFKSLKS